MSKNQSRWKHPITEIAHLLGSGQLRSGHTSSKEDAATWPAVFSSIEGPLTDVVEEDDAIKISAELPGLDKDDFKLEVQEDRVVLKGEKKEEKEEKEKDYHYSERRYGSFFRSIPLPCAVDTEAVTADFNKGVLVVTLPKSNNGKSRAVEIGSA